MLIAGTAVNAPQTLASRQLTPIHGLLADEHVALLSRQLWIFLGNCGRMGLYSQQFATRPISALAQKQTFGPRKRDVRFTPKRGHGSSRS